MKHVDVFPVIWYQSIPGPALGPQQVQSFSAQLRCLKRCPNVKKKERKPSCRSWFTRVPQGHGTPLMVSFPYYEPISLGILMGIVWETCQKGVPLLGAPENPTEKILKKLKIYREYIRDIHLQCPAQMNFPYLNLIHTYHLYTTYTCTNSIDFVMCRETKIYKRM